MKKVITVRDMILKMVMAKITADMLLNSESVSSADARQDAFDYMSAYCTNPDSAVFSPFFGYAKIGEIINLDAKYSECGFDTKSKIETIINNAYLTILDKIL